MRRHFQIFQSDAASRYLPSLLVLAVFLATMATAGLLAAERTLVQWRTAAPTILTVQLPSSDNAAQDEDRADALVRRLRAEPGIASVERIPKESVSRLLKPWLGDDFDASALPLPPVLHVELQQDSTTTADDISRLATGVAANAIVDNHREWRERLVNYVSWLRLGIAGSLVLVIIVTGLTALFLTLSRMAIHHQAITLLHQLGASDRFVVRGLVRQAGISAMISAVLGFALALALLAVLTAASRELDETFLPVLRLDALDWVWLALVPLGFVIFTVLVAARTASFQLRRMP
jgi:cell division transport system permease protein